MRSWAVVTVAVAAVLAGPGLLAGPASAAAPATQNASVSPAVIPDNVSTQNFTISGFDVGVPPSTQYTVKFAGPQAGTSSSENYIGSGTSTSDGSTVYATVDFLQNGGYPDPGAYDVRVCANGDTSCQTPLAEGGITIDPGNPSLTAVAPAEIPDDSSQTVTITGTNFYAGTTIDFYDGSTKVSSVTTNDSSGNSTVTVESPSKITAVVSASGATSGQPRQLTMQLSIPEQSDYASAPFTIDPVLHLTGFSPTSAADQPKDPQPTGFTVEGALPAGAACQLTLAPATAVPGQDPLPPIDGVVNQAGTYWQSSGAGYSFTKEAPVGYAVQLTCNPGTATAVAGVASQAFQVTSPAPTVSSVQPNAIGQGGAEQLTITGHNLTQGSTVTFGPTQNNSQGGSGLTGGLLTGIADDPATGLLTGVVTVTAAPDATTGDATVTVTDASGQSSGSSSGTITVDPGPTISKVNSSSTDSNGVASAGQGAADRTLTITGSNFQSGAQVSLSDDSGDSVPVDTTSVSADGNTVTVHLHVPAATPTGLYTLTVTNPDAGAATQRDALDVTAAPTVTGLDPSTFQAGTSSSAATASGSHFVAGSSTNDSTTLTVSGGAASITVSPSDSNDHSLAVHVSTPQSTAPGSYDVTATNPDGGTSTCQSCLSVTAGHVPGPPSHVVARAHGRRARITWVAPTTDGGSPITSYVVHAKARGFSRTKTVHATHATFRHLRSGRRYRFSVAATNRYGTGAAAYSNRVRIGRRP